MAELRCRLKIMRTRCRLSDVDNKGAEGAVCPSQEGWKRTKAGRKREGIGRKGERRGKEKGRKTESEREA